MYFSCRTNTLINFVIRSYVFLNYSSSLRQRWKIVCFHMLVSLYILFISCGCRVCLSKIAYKSQFNIHATTYLEVLIKIKVNIGIWTHNHLVIVYSRLFGYGESKRNLEKERTNIYQVLEKGFCFINYYQTQNNCS